LGELEDLGFLFGNWSIELIVCFFVVVVFCEGGERESESEKTNK